MSDKQWTREEVLGQLVTIIVETRGVAETEVIEEAKLFDDIHLESIDFLEISWRMEESFGFPYPTDDLGNVFSVRTLADIDRVLEEEREHLHLSFDIETLDGRNPFDLGKLRQLILDRFTVGYLVDFVMAECAKRTTAVP